MTEILATPSVLRKEKVSFSNFFVDDNFYTFIS